MDSIRARFPFTIEGSHPEIDIVVEIDRKEDLVSFSLRYDIDVEIENAKIRSKREINGYFIYCYKFIDMNAAIDFMRNKSVKAVQQRRLPDVDAIEEEMNAFMGKYESGESRSKRKKLVIGPDGFGKYV